jgi:hypothetical protein
MVTQPPAAAIYGYPLKPQRHFDLLDGWLACTPYRFCFTRLYVIVSNDIISRKFQVLSVIELAGPNFKPPGIGSRQEF